METENNPKLGTFVRVYGIASKSVEKLIATGMRNWPTNSKNCILFVDYSDFDIPLGTKFTLFAENELGNKLHDISAKLIQVTQQWIKPYNQIPEGHKTICEIELDEQSGNLLRLMLPTVNTWYAAKERFLLGTKRDN